MDPMTDAMTYVPHTDHTFDIEINTIAAPDKPF